MEFVTVFNRTQKPLEVTWDGKRHALPVGRSQHPRTIAEAAKRQNILMGSENPYTLEVVSLVGIEEAGDDISPVEVPVNPAIERWNRSKLPADQQKVEVIEGNGMYRPRVDGAGPLPQDSNFVDPKV